MSTGNLNDRKPVLDLLHQVVGNKGYVSKSLCQTLLKTLGIQLVTKLPGNLKNRLLPLVDRLLVPKRAIIASVIDQLKNISCS